MNRGWGGHSDSSDIYVGICVVCVIHVNECCTNESINAGIQHTEQNLSDKGPSSAIQCGTRVKSLPVVR